MPKILKTLETLTNELNLSNSTEIATRGNRSLGNSDSDNTLKYIGYFLLGAGALIWVMFAVIEWFFSDWKDETKSTSRKIFEKIAYTIFLPLIGVWKLVVCCAKCLESEECAQCCSQITNGASEIVSVGAQLAAGAAAETGQRQPLLDNSHRPDDSQIRTYQQISRDQTWYNR